MLIVHLSPVNKSGIEDAIAKRYVPFDATSVSVGDVIRWVERVRELQPSSKEEGKIGRDEVSDVTDPANEGIVSRIERKKDGRVILHLSHPLGAPSFTHYIELDRRLSVMYHVVSMFSTKRMIPVMLHDCWMLSKESAGSLRKEPKHNWFSYTSTNLSGRIHFYNISFLHSLQNPQYAVHIKTVRRSKEYCERSIDYVDFREFYNSCEYFYRVASLVYGIEWEDLSATLFKIGGFDALEKISRSLFDHCVDGKNVTGVGMIDETFKELDDGAMYTFLAMAYRKHTDKDFIEVIDKIGVSEYLNMINLGIGLDGIMAKAANPSIDSELLISY